MRIIDFSYYNPHSPIMRIALEDGTTHSIRNTVFVAYANKHKKSIFAVVAKLTKKELSYDVKLDTIY